MKHFFGEFYKGKTIFLTGHTGFIGSWLSILLEKLGAKVIGYALEPNTPKDNYVLSNIQEKIINIIGDIRNFKKLEENFDKYKPDIIIHLAAQPIVRKSYLTPKETFDINIGGTINIFELFRKTKFGKVLINFTSDKCYENQEIKHSYHEGDPLGGYDPYSSSKACSEHITSAYYNSFFRSSVISKSKSVASVRCGNIIGGGDWQEDRLIPDCMRAIKNDRAIVLRNPSSIRPWQFVLEPIRGLLMLTMKLWEEGKEYSGSWNFGPKKSDNFSVKEIIEKIFQYIGFDTHKIITDQKSNEFHETKFLMLNINKAKTYLKWQPKLSIDETIKLLCDWYMEESVNYDFIINQIEYYFNQIK